jgi:hypothetical protein
VQLHSTGWQIPKEHFERGLEPLPLANTVLLQKQEARGAPRKSAAE